ncbi:serine/threonine-protein kinase HAL4/sat4 [Mortierella polycephala]|uniref:non-specific serine/threonine protein kinase n=1 Tax=Mortierella polycephala TaxID=41804 RepID=A0A9P6Q513_9FUNG|nr:serine/threonine-protein kinase HAL4/sat4 [Mortierella polycephala]
MPVKNAHLIVSDLYSQRLCQPSHQGPSSPSQPQQHEQDYLSHSLPRHHTEVSRADCVQASMLAVEDQVPDDDVDSKRFSTDQQCSFISATGAYHRKKYDKSPGQDDTVQNLAVAGPVEFTSEPVVTLRAPTTRSTTIISIASSSGRPRMTHRLSYLAHLQDLELEEDENASELKAPCELINDPEANTASASPLSSLKEPPQESTSALRALCYDKAALMSNSIHKPPSSQNLNIAATPSIPKLYKRLLRVFKPPPDSSDSDTGSPPSEMNHSSVASSHARGPFGLPSCPENNSRNQAGRSSIKKAPIERPAVVIPSPAIAAAIANAAVLAHKPTESIGFRARFLRKLISSPNLNMTNPASGPHNGGLNSGGVISEPQGPHNHASYLSKQCLSPTASDFEHGNSCPAGQRIQAQRSAGRRRAATMPRSPPPMPTLQSKYGVPGRELGAGTQAQVMLLRVKSTKRAQASYPFSSTRKEAPVSVPSDSSNELAPDDSHLSEPVDATLMPRGRSGTLITTTEEKVVPEQREAYRKRLMRRTSTGGLSMASDSGGLIYAIKKFRPPKATETHRHYLKKVCAEFCISTSMDHENIIRTIDLVRDQPKQEPVDDEQENQLTGHHHHNAATYRRDDMSKAYIRNDYHDCNCPRDHSRHGRVVMADRELQSSIRQSSLGGPSSFSSQYKQHTISRKPVISKRQRVLSTDTISSRRSPVGTLERAVSPHRRSHHDHSYKQTIPQGNNLPHPSSQRQPLCSSTEARVIAAWKKKQQQEHDRHQREVQRLKRQKQDEKQRAKQFKMDQFPEYCMVMEFAGGGDLFNLLTKTHPPISLQEKHCLWRQLVNGVQYMHSMGVAHRDLKPENILIDATGRILKITDFGIANVFKSVGDPIPLPCRGIIGSEPYIAPEEFYQDEYDPRAVDVWACGIIFYVMYYSAMPWTRADRRKDTRFARYVNDIVNHRYSEVQRRLHFERRQLYNLSLVMYSKSSIGSGSSGSTSQGSYDSALPNTLDRSQDTQYRRPLQERNGGSADSSPSGSLASPASDIDPDSPQTPFDGSPDTNSKRTTIDSLSSVKPIDETVASTCPPPTVYNTFAYNGNLGGHQFIDRIENPGCRRILYAILEPDARKRVTIDQIVNDEWVAKIRYCTDFAPGSGLLHHRHAVPKKIKT